MPEGLTLHLLGDRSLKSRIADTLLEDQYKFLIISPSHFFLELEMFQTKVVDKIKTCTSVQ
jgi:hypothetical protein